MLTRHPIKAAMAAAVLLILAGCMVLPGKFVSELAVRSDGTFTFHYKGEIVLAALAQPGKASLPDALQTDAEKFEANPCTNPATDEEHPCSAAELAQQRSTWNAGLRERQSAMVDEGTQNRKAMQMMMGGIDPDDPQAAQAFADRLARQQGWTSVVSKGQGKFQVEYSAAGRLDHDFTFPTIERLPLVMPFVSVIRRSDGALRIDAPAFSSSAANPVIPGLAAMGGKVAASKGQAGPPTAEGTFTVRTDGQILANNTDEGPKPDPAGDLRLDWKVDARTTAAPTALVKLGK